MKSVRNKNLGSLPPKLTSFDKSDLPIEQFGTETEVEKQIKRFLDKQLDTKITLKDHFAQHRKFANSSTFTPLTQLIHGECSLEKFQEIETAEEKRQELQRSGLNEDEIRLFATTQNSESFKDKGTLTNPDVLTQKVKEIQQKLIAHEKELTKPETFKNVKVLSRHEMDIEKTLYVGCDTKKHIGTVITERKIEPLSENDPFKKVKELSEKLSYVCHKKRKKKLNKQQNIHSIQTSESANEELIYDPNIHHVIVPLEEHEVIKKKLRLEEIKAIPRFNNYEPGIPSKVLFLKNLHPKIEICDLHSLFSRFEFENSAPIHYRILTGRMKGQAFVEFKNVQIAEKALQFGNGYILKDKPIIIQFGRQNS